MRNKNKMLIIFLIIISLTTFVSAEVQHYYEIDLMYDHEEIYYKNIKVIPSNEDLTIPEGKYIAELVSLDNQILNITFFAFPLTILWDGVNEETGEIDRGGMIELNQTEIILFIPYFENAQEINIYDWDLNKKLTIPLTDFSEETLVENFEEDPMEKQSQQFIEKENSETSQTENSYLWLWLTLGFVFILALIMIIRMIRKK
jgi:hypothetical protein